MRIKELFTVPEGKKITEKVFSRVLISSICSIVLCMACLISTTWAWFTVSIENRDNEIKVATVTANELVTNGVDVIGQSDDGGYHLAPGIYSVSIQLKNDATEAKAPVYVWMSVYSNGEYFTFYFDCEGKTGEVKQLNTLKIGEKGATLYFSTHWKAPELGVVITGDPIEIGPFPVEPIVDSTEAPTEEPTQTPEQTEDPDAGDEEAPTEEPTEETVEDPSEDVTDTSSDEPAAE